MNNSAVFSWSKQVYAAADGQPTKAHGMQPTGCEDPTLVVAQVLVAVGVVGIPSGSALRIAVLYGSIVHINCTSGHAEVGTDARADAAYGQSACGCACG